MRKLLPSTRTVLLLATVGAVIIGTGVATGAIPGADGTITACYNARDGAVRVIDGESGATCAGNERKLSWNQRGPAGPPGAKGDKGDPGPQGPAASDASRLLGPDADLPGGQTLAVAIDGYEILSGVSTYRISCTRGRASSSSPERCRHRWRSSRGMRPLGSGPRAGRGASPSPSTTPRVSRFAATGSSAASRLRYSPRATAVRSPSRRNTSRGSRRNSTPAVTHSRRNRRPMIRH
jgi:hypothetical protein